MSDSYDTSANEKAEIANKAGVTEQDLEYEHHEIPPVEQRVRHWHHFRNGGLLSSAAGVAMLIAGHFAGSGRSMQIGGFLILAGAVVFTVGVIGGWVTHERPLD
jgi:hypothetical protein